MIRVTLQDGSTYVDFPDNTSPEKIREVMSKKFYRAGPEIMQGARTEQYKPKNLLEEPVPPVKTPIGTILNAIGYPQERLQRALTSPAGTPLQQKIVGTAGGLLAGFVPYEMGPKEMALGMASSIKMVGGKISLLESGTYRGTRFTSSFGPHDSQVVARIGSKDVGRLWYTKKPDGGFTVNKIEVLPEFRRKGVATTLMEEVVSKEGPYRGATTAMTPEGSAFFKSYKKPTKALIKRTPEEERRTSNQIMSFIKERDRKFYEFLE